MEVYLKSLIQERFEVVPTLLTEEEKEGKEGKEEEKEGKEEEKEGKEEEEGKEGKVELHLGLAQEDDSFPHLSILQRLVEFLDGQ